MEKAEILDLTLQFVKNKCSSRASSTQHHQQRSAPVHHRPQPPHPHPHPHPHTHQMLTPAAPSLIPAPLPLHHADVRAAGYQAARQEVLRFMDMSSAPAHARSSLTENLSVRIPQESDNLYKKYKHRAACSKGLVNVKSPGSNDLLKVASPTETPVWRPF